MEMSSKSEGKGAERHVVVYNVPMAEGMVKGVSAEKRVSLKTRVDTWHSDVQEQRGGTGEGKGEEEPEEGEKILGRRVIMKGW